ncbi:MAG: methionine--tRNA ligase, partial [Microvirga sp.]
GIMAQAVIPGAAAKLLDLLGVAPEQRFIARLGPHGRVAPGGAVMQPEPIFPRYVEAGEA